MNNLVDDYSRLLLRIVPSDAPAGAVLLGLVLYWLAMPLAALAASVVTATGSLESLPWRKRLFGAAWTLAGINVVYAVRYWIGAYHSSLVFLNNLLLVPFYLAVLAFTVQAHRIAEVYTAGMSDEADRPYVRWFSVVERIGLYAQAIGLVTFALSPVNVYVRIFETGFLLTTLGAFVRAIMVARDDTDTPEVGRLLRGVGAASLTVSTISVVLLILRELEAVPVWVDSAYAYPFFLGSVSILALRVFGDGLTRRTLLQLASASVQAPETGSPSDAEFVAAAVVQFRLTPRERAVLALLMEGRSTRDIARYLEMSDKTVRNHISSMYGKTETTNRVELVHVFEPAG